MCESDNKIIVLNRAGWINKDRILFYNYELQYKDNAPEKFCTREEMCKKYKLTRGSIHQLINDGKKGKDPCRGGCLYLKPTVCFKPTASCVSNVNHCLN